MITQKKVSVRQYVPLERISEILCNALEGGSNYWYMIVEKIQPKEWNFFMSPGDDNKYPHLYPLNGGALLINDDHADDPTIEIPVKLDMARVKKGLSIMAKNHPGHYGDFLNESDDAITADVFLQCCIFGEVIYG